MNINALSHTHDPETSHLAVVQLDPNDTAKLKDALLILLDGSPRTATELTAAYLHRAEMMRWPLGYELQDIRRRLSDLHARHHVIRESGERRPTRRGKQSVVWELSVPVEEARLIAGAS